jgi:hypothetical protein
LELQGAILGKALNYVQTLASKSPRVLVLGGGAEADAARLVTTLKQLGSDAKFASALTDSDAKWADAVYAFSGHLTVSLSQSCADYGMLSLTGELPAVEAGRASVAVTSDQQKASLVINLTRVQTEQHRLSSQLLKLARVIR